MALNIDSTYQNIFYDYVLDDIRDTLVTEFGASARVYISPEIKYQTNLQVRIWGTSSEETDRITSSMWQKRYNVDIVVYSVNKNTDERFYKQFYQDSERVYQLLWNNYKGAKQVTVSSTALTLLDGNVESIEYLIGDEDDEVDGLHQAIITFNILVNRED